MSVNWSRLPKDLLRVVAKKVNIHPSGHAYFVSVCSSWNSIGTETSHHYFLGLPILKQTETNDGEKTNMQGLHQSNTKETYFHHRYYCCGASLGWFAFFCDSSDVQLFNPLSRTKFQFPSWTSLPVAHLGDIERVILSSEPVEGSVVIATYRIRKKLCLGFCRIGDGTWKHVPFSEGKHYSDAIYFEGMIYAFNSNSSNAWSCDIIDINNIGNEHPDRVVLPNLGNPKNKRFLVALKSELFLIEKMYNSFLIYKLVAVGFHSEWRKVNSIGDNAIFVGCNKTFVLSVNDFLGCKANSIYFTEGEEVYDYVGQHVEYDIRVFDMDHRTIEDMHVGTGEVPICCVNEDWEEGLEKTIMEAQDIFY